MTGHPTPDFASLLRQLRTEAGLTQEELAEAAGLSPRTVSDLERGISKAARKRTAILLADSMGLTGQVRVLFIVAARGRVRTAEVMAANTGHAPLVQAAAVLLNQQAPAAAAAPSHPVPVPRELPADVAAFTGRAAELAELSRLLPAAGRGEIPGPVLISATSGTAGVGKTALVVHWAHQVADQFPDGQLHVNLRGYDPGRPMRAADALAGFMRALGVPSQDIPPGLEERAARYRSLLAGRRMLVLLDNAGEVEQIRPLLPGASGCVVVVTSRDALTGLVARDGAVRLEVGLLPPEDAAGLLRTLIGKRAAADPAATAALAERCCRLPLALRVAAELAATRAAPLAGLVTELADQQRRLDLLEVDGDPWTAVRAVFSWSCRHLEPAAARAFRLASLHSGADLDRYATAALTGSTLHQADRVLDRLARAHLIQPGPPGRYTMHDLLRAYARELAAAQDGQDGQWSAQTRLFDYYLYTAAAAMDTLIPSAQHQRPRIPRPASPVPPLTDPAAARTWLDTERASLAAVAAHTADHGWPAHTTRLASTVFRYLYTSGHFPEATIIDNCARQAARLTGDRAAEAHALNGLGLVDQQQGRYQQAVSHLQQALALYRETGDRLGEARVLNNLGGTVLQKGSYRQAASHFQQALALYRETGDLVGQARALANLGVIDERQGRYQQANSFNQQALALYLETGDRRGEARTLENLGVVDGRQGHYGQAVSHIQQALVLSRETADRPGEAHMLANLGEIELGQGHYHQAASNWRQSLALYRETGNRAGQADALNGLGEVSLAIGQPGLARTQHTSALALASQTFDKQQEARAHHGLGRVCQSAGEPGQARHHLQQALILYTSLGSPHADRVRGQLGATGITPASQTSGDDAGMPSCPGDTYSSGTDV